MRGVMIAFAVLWFVGFSAAGEPGGFAPDLNPVKFLPAPSHPPVEVATKSRAAWVVVPKSASRSLNSAVNDMVTMIEKSTGVKLPVVKEGEPNATLSADQPAILVGATAEALAAGIDPATMPVEGFTIKTAANRVFIVGNDREVPDSTLVSEGSAWGVYEFCERFVDVRWYWADPPQSYLGVSIPKLDSLIVMPVCLTDAPVFRKREIWPSGGPRVAPFDLDGHHRRMRSADTWPVRVRVHAPHDWGKIYKDSRPEIFQLRSDGQRDWAMLCYGNPKTITTYLEQIEAQTAPGAKTDASAIVVDRNTITVSPADMAVSCFCDDCKKRWDPSGGQYGTASNILSLFVKELAEKVKQRWPEKTVIFLPYKNYTLAPKDPSLRFPGNVEVQICGMPGLAQYKEPAINASEQANIDAWVRVSGRKIQNWHYSVWPEDRTEAAYFFPHVAQRHYRDNRDKTVGSFINGEFNHWTRQHVSLYVWMRLLWNPEFNVDAAIDEFCKRMYGPAASSMRQLVGMQIDGWEKSRWPDGEFSSNGIYNVSYPRADVVKMEKLLDTAVEQAKNDDLVSKRLALISGPLRKFFAESKDLAEGTGRQTLEVNQTAEEPVIDGKLDDACWQTIKPVMMVRALDEKNPAPKFPTEVRAVWTRRGVTFGFRMAEPEPDKMTRDIARDSRDASLLWWNENVEIFLDITGQRKGYHQFIINCNGAIYDSVGKDASWNAAGMKVGTFVGKDFWSAEVYIPYDAFTPAPRPNTGTVWMGNFTRHRVGDRTDREMQRLSTTFTGPSNNENAFGPLKFIER